LAYLQNKGSKRASPSAAVSNPHIQSQAILLFKAKPVPSKIWGSWKPSEWLIHPHPPQQEKLWVEKYLHSLLPSKLVTFVRKVFWMKISPMIPAIAAVDVEFI
jgi:hypothetical protein